MQIQTIRKGFQAFKFKFEVFERDSKHSNANSKHSKVIGSIRMQIRAIRKGFVAFKCKFEPFERVSKHSNEIRAIRKGSKYLNANSNRLKGIGSIQMEMLTTRKVFEAF